MSKEQKNPLDHAWEWRDMGGELMLMTVGGGAMVVLAARSGRPGPRRGATITTRDTQTGLLRPIKADDEVARMLAMAPGLARLVRAQAVMIDAITGVVEACVKNPAPATNHLPAGVAVAGIIELITDPEWLKVDALVKTLLMPAQPAPAAPEQGGAT